jgi:uncharacterized protein YkwD
MISAIPGGHRPNPPLVVARDPTREEGRLMMGSMTKPTKMMALLLLVVVLFLSHHADASVNNPPLGDLLAKANDTTSSSSPTEQDNKTEEVLEEIDKLKQEANKAGLVSFTNGTGSYTGMPREFVDGHNEVRQGYGAPPVKWNNKLAHHARRWSNAMRKDCQLMHSAGHNYGESIFVSHKSTGWNATAKDALASWGSEEPIYDRRTGNCTAGHPYSDCGHFINMVADKNQKIGCGRAECYGGGVFITCNYYLYNRDP